MGNRHRRKVIADRMNREQKTLPDRVRQLEVVADALLRCVGERKATRAIAQRIAEDSGRTPQPGPIGRAWRAITGVFTRDDGPKYDVLQPVADEGTP